MTSKEKIVAKKKRINNNKKLLKSIPFCDLIRILTKKNTANGELIKQLKGYEIARSRTTKVMSLEQIEQIKAPLERAMNGSDEVNADLQECRIGFDEVLQEKQEQEESE